MRFKLDMPFDSFTEPVLEAVLDEIKAHIGVGEGGREEEMDGGAGGEMKGGEGSERGEGR
jgi:hypothetical protein